ncbi:MAG TPA: DUF4337 domain-containing protein [Candidatus Binatia bacterium]|nr:DUF4337 domain-containing protein [Candidatus Binatia bacterium]
MSLEEELKEGAEHAHQRGEKGIGLTMAIVAVLLAIATLMGHRTHTEEGLIQGKIVDEWNFYQAKHSRAHEYGAMAEVAALLPNGKELALKDYKKSLDEECGTPPEHGCSSPARDSSILRPLLTPESTSDGKEDKKEQDKQAKHESPAKQDAVQEHGKEANAAKEKQEGKSSSHKPGAVNIQESAKEMERERDLVERRANYYDGAELFLEISIVLCSIALLADAKLFWRLSFISTILGVGVALFGFLGVH